MQIQSESSVFVFASSGPVKPRGLGSSSFDCCDSASSEKVASDGGFYLNGSNFSKVMAESQNDKLYKAEYAKSGRASCKKCKENIAKDSLRMAIMVQVTVAASEEDVTNPVLTVVYCRGYEMSIYSTSTLSTNQLTSE